MGCILLVIFRFVFPCLDEFLDKNKRLCRLVVCRNI